MNRLKRLWIILTLLVLSISVLGYIAAVGMNQKDAQIEYHVQQAADLQKEIERLEKEIAKELHYKKLELEIIECESDGKHEGVWGDGGLSYGIFQYQEATFHEDAKLAGIQNADWHSKEHQLLAGRAALRRGEEEQWWNCYQKAKEGI